MWEIYESKYSELLDKGLLRSQRIIESAQLTKSVVDHQDILMFSSSNYLSISELPTLWDKAIEVSKTYGAGAGGSRLTTGNTALHVELEARLAKMTGYESTLLFSSGYMANIGIFSALVTPDTLVFSDEKNHASIIDGLRMSRAQVNVYPHMNLEALETMVGDARRNGHKGPIILVSDYVFSMDGDVLLLEDFVKVGKRWEAITVIDDAHGFGITNMPYTPRPDILMGCLSKAIGSEGAFVASSQLIIHLLQNLGRSYMFSTSCSPFSIAFALSALDYIQEHPELIERLQHNQQYLVQRLASIGFAVQNSSHIVPIPMGSATRAVAMAEKLWEDGIWTTPIRYPAVPEGEAILRITLMAGHTEEQIDELVHSLQRNTEKTL